MSYRNIKPVKSFESYIHPHNTAQFNWCFNGEDLATSTFAGQKIMIYINDDGKTYQLTYLDMAHPKKFKSIKDAQISAKDFAKAVLVHMIKMIVFDDHDVRC